MKNMNPPKIQRLTKNKNIYYESSYQCWASTQFGRLKTASNELKLNQNQVWLVEPGFKLEVGFQFFQRIRTNQDQDPKILIDLKNWNCDFYFYFGRKLLELRANPKLTAGLGPGYPELDWNEV